MQNIIKGIEFLYKGKANFSLIGSSYEGVEWLSPDLPKPTKTQIEQAYEQYLLSDEARKEKLSSIRAERGRRLNDTAWVFMRQMTGTPEQKLPAEEYAKWEAYWAALRDFPDTCDPENPVWPAAPNEEVG